MTSHPLRKPILRGAAATTEEGSHQPPATIEQSPSFRDWEDMLESFRNDPLHDRLSRADSLSQVMSEEMGEEKMSERDYMPRSPSGSGGWFRSYVNGEKFGNGLEGVPPMTKLVEPRNSVVFAPPETEAAPSAELPRPPLVRRRSGDSTLEGAGLGSINVGASRLSNITGPWASSTSSLQEPEGRFQPASKTFIFEGPANALALGLPGRVWAILASRSTVAGDGRDNSFSMLGISFKYTAADQTLTRVCACAGNYSRVDDLVKGGLASRAYETARTLLTGGESIADNAVLREVLVFERLMQALDEIKGAYPGWFFERTGTNGLKAGCVYSFPQGGTDNAGIITVGDCVAKAGNCAISGNRTWHKGARSALIGTWGIWLESLSAGGYAMSIAVVLLFTWASAGGSTNPPLPSELDVIAEAASSSGHARDLSGQPGGELLTALGLLSTANAGRVTVHGGSLGLPLSYSGPVKGRDLRVFCAGAVWRTCIDKAEETASPDLLVIDMGLWGKSSAERVPVLMVGESRVEGVLASLRRSDVVPGVTLVKTYAGWKNAERSGEGRHLLDKDWGQVDLLIGPPELIYFSSLFFLLLLTASSVDVPVALLEVSLVLSAVYRPRCLHAFHLDCLTGWQGPEVLLSAFLVLWTIAVVTDGSLRTTGASLAFVLLVGMQVWRGLLCYGPRSLRYRAWRVAGTWGFKRAGARCGDIGVKHVSDFVYVHRKMGSRFPAHTTSRPGMLTFGPLAVCGAALEAQG